MHKLFSSSDYFPTHSLELKKRHLFKYYKLHLATKYRDDSNNTIYKIVCTPKIEDGTYFKTTGWIERDEVAEELKQLSIPNQMGMDMSYEELVEKYGEDNARFLWDD